MSGLPSLSTTPASLRRVGDFFVEVLLGDRDLAFGERLLQQQVRNLDFQHLPGRIASGIPRPIPSTEFARR